MNHYFLLDRIQRRDMVDMIYLNHDHTVQMTPADEWNNNAYIPFLMIKS